MVKSKQGEKEAKLILKTLGYEFDEQYQDDNSQKTMPDLRFSEGRFLEVTHTKHNNRIFTSVNKYAKMSIEEQLRISKEASEAYDRLIKFEYDRDENGRFTETGKERCKKDLKIIKSHNGYDPTNWEEPFSEFGCDSAIIEFDSKKVLQTIVDDKGKLYANRVDIDLFVFLVEDELYSVDYYLRTCNENGWAQSFLNSISNTTFKKIYLCEWDIYKQQYNMGNPRIIIIRKCDEEEDALLKWEYFNWGKEE